jgi:hypothetical protein
LDWSRAILWCPGLNFPYSGNNALQAAWGNLKNCSQTQAPMSDKPPTKSAALTQKRTQERLFELVDIRPDTQCQIAFKPMIAFRSRPEPSLTDGLSPLSTHYAIHQLLQMILIKC